MARRKKRLNIAGQRIVIKPMDAKTGLASIIEITRVLHTASPYLANMADRSRKVRMLSLMRMITELEELPDVIFNIVYLSTGISKHMLETQATTKELMTAFAYIIKVNEWEKFWTVAYALRITDSETVIDWAMARFDRLVTRKT